VALIAKNTGWSRAEILRLPFAEFKAHVIMFTPDRP
jgi:hypothetical protein